MTKILEVKYLLNAQCKVIAFTKMRKILIRINKIKNSVSYKEAFGLRKTSKAQKIINKFEKQLKIGTTIPCMENI